MLLTSSNIRQETFIGRKNVTSNVCAKKRGITWQENKFNLIINAEFYHIYLMTHVISSYHPSETEALQDFSEMVWLLIAPSL